MSIVVRYPMGKTAKSILVIFKLKLKYNPDYWLDTAKLKSNLNAKSEYVGSK